MTNQKPRKPPLPDLTPEQKIAVMKALRKKHSTPTSRAYHSAKQAVKESREAGWLAEAYDITLTIIKSLPGKR